MQLTSQGAAEGDNAGVARSCKPGEPRTSKTGENISDVIVADSSPDLPSRIRRTHGKKPESAFIELWDSWMKSVIALNGRVVWVSQGIRWCYNQENLFKADVYTLGRISDSVPMDAVNKNRNPEFFSPFSSVFFELTMLFSTYKTCFISLSSLPHYIKRGLCSYNEK